MTRQPEMSVNMRAILVDWLVEVQQSFELVHETLYLAVKLTDSYLDRQMATVAKNLLQLIGSTALNVACKFEVCSLIFCFLVFSVPVFTTLHGMPARISYEKGVGLSVSPSDCRMHDL